MLQTTFETFLGFQNAFRDSVVVLRSRLCTNTNHATSNFPVVIRASVEDSSASIQANTTLTNSSIFPHRSVFGRGRRRYCLINKFRYQSLNIEASYWFRALSFSSEWEPQAVHCVRTNGSHLLEVWSLGEPEIGTTFASIFTAIVVVCSHQRSKVDKLIDHLDLSSSITTSGILLLSVPPASMYVVFNALF